VAGLALALVCAAAGGGRALASVSVSCPQGEVRALDVGMGTSVLVREGGHAVLLDGGPPGAGLLQQLRSLGVRRIDVAVASHPHRDHVEGFVDILGHMPVGRVVGPVIMSWGMGSKLVAAAKRAHVPVQTAASGDHLDAGGVHLDVLAPDPGPAPEVEAPDRVNGYSLLVRVTLDGVSVIAPGDLQSEDQQQLLDRDLRAPILIAPHHGSANLDDGFVAAVAPRVVLVTVGAQNPYGLPKDKALKLFSRYGPVLRTDTQGMVTVCLDHGRAQVYTQKKETMKQQAPTGRSNAPEVFG
jgi:competence protein ComEC